MLASINLALQYTNDVTVFISTVGNLNGAITIEDQRIEAAITSLSGISGSGIGGCPYYRT